MADESFEEKRWHWWLSRVILPIFLAVAAAVVAVYVGHVKGENGRQMPQADFGTNGGWGPDRKTFTMADPAPYAVLNSITDNPTAGDERDFTRARMAGTDQMYADTVSAQIGDTVEVLVWVDNDVSDVYADQSSAIVHGLTAQLVNQALGTRLPFSVELDANNAISVWDGATIVTNQSARLVYVFGSAKMDSADIHDQPMNDGAFGIGDKMLVGEFRQDGELPAGRAPNGMERSGYFQFQLHIEAAK